MSGMECLEYCSEFLKNRHKMEKKKIHHTATLCCLPSIDGDGILPPCARVGTEVCITPFQPTLK